MKTFTYSQKKWAMTGCLLFVLGFSLSAHNRTTGANYVDLASEKPSPVYEEITRKDGKKFLLKYEADKAKPNEVTNVTAQPLDTEGNICTNCDNFTIALGGELNSSNLGDLKEVAVTMIEKQEIKKTIKVISASSSGANKEEEYEEDRVKSDRVDASLRKDLERIKEEIRDAREVQLVAYQEASTAQSIPEQQAALSDAKQAEKDKRDALIKLRELLVKHSRKNGDISPEFSKAERLLIKEEKEHIADNGDALVLKNDLRKLVEELKIQHLAAKNQLLGDVSNSILNKYVTDFDEYVKAVVSGVFTQNNPSQNGAGRVANSSGGSINPGNMNTSIRSELNPNFTTLPSSSNNGGVFTVSPESTVTPEQRLAAEQARLRLQQNRMLNPNQNPMLNNRSARRN